MNDYDQNCVQLFWWIQEIIAHIEIHSTLHKKWMILSTLPFNYSDEFKKLSHTLRFIAHCIRNEMILIRVSVPLFWSIQEIIPHIEIHSTLHKKWMIVNRVLFNYSDEFKKLPHTLRITAHCIRNEWFQRAELCSAVLMNSRN